MSLEVKRAASWRRYQCPEECPCVDREEHMRERRAEGMREMAREAWLRRQQRAQRELGS